jgi:hypothetical protein
MTGRDSFTLDRIREFDSGEEAREYETRFLRKTRARTNPKLINCHDNAFPSFGSPEFVEMLTVKYGVENISQLDEVKEKKKQTSLRNHGVESWMQSEEGKKHMVEYMIQHHGVENISQLDDVKEKKKQTSLRNHGVESWMQSEEGKIKFKEISLRKYGVENISQSPDIKEKKRQSALAKYGVENVSKSPEVIAKISETHMRIYGVPHASQHPDVIAKINLAKTKLSQRPEVDVIKRYVKRNKLKLGRGWYQRSTADLQKMISEFVEKYGPL